MGNLEAAALIFVGQRLAIMVDVGIKWTLRNRFRNEARNNGASDSNTRTVKVHKDVPYPQGKIKNAKKLGSDFRCLPTRGGSPHRVLGYPCQSEVEPRGTCATREFRVLL